MPKASNAIPGIPSERPEACECGHTEFSSHGVSAPIVGGKKTKGAIRWKCKSCGKKTTGRPIGGRGHIEFNALKSINTKLVKRQVYAVTYAQNDTSPHEGFLENLLAYMAFRKGKLVAIPGTYRNPSLYYKPFFKPAWDAAIKPYLFAGRAELGPHLTILGDLRIQPTAVTPLVGHESISGHRSAIIGHPKLALKTVAEPQSRLPKIMTTTGAVTVQNYSHTRAGKIGEFHHTLGACLVEVRGDQWHIRQINAMRDGSFIDLGWQVKNGKVSKAPHAAALALGDVHVWFINKAVQKATFGKGGIVDTLGPERIVLHDTFDAFSISHHHRRDPFLTALKSDTGLNLVAREMRDTVNWVFDTMPAGVEVAIVASNHDEHLMRWLRENDWREDPQNSEFYLETALYVRRNTRMVDGEPHLPDPFHYWFRKDVRSEEFTKGRKFVLLERGQSYEVLGVDLANHGDLGANGSRGSLKQYARMGSKTISGHTHTFGIDEGAYSAATSSLLKRGFNRGLSTWMHGHCVEYANGKRSLIIIIDGKWHL